MQISLILTYIFFQFCRRQNCKKFNLAFGQIEFFPILPSAKLKKLKICEANFQKLKKSKKQPSKIIKRAISRAEHPILWTLQKFSRGTPKMASFSVTNLASADFLAKLCPRDCILLSFWSCKILDFGVVKNAKVVFFHFF